MMAGSVLALCFEYLKAPRCALVKAILFGLLIGITVGFWGGYKLGREQDVVSLRIQEARYGQILDHAARLCREAQRPKIVPVK
jgi:hypothetical protein